MPVAAPVLTGEGHVVTAEHIEGGAGGRDDTDAIDERAQPGCGHAEQGQVFLTEGLPQNLVFGIEAAGNGEAGNGDARPEVGFLGNRHELAKTAHLSHVLLVMAGEDHRS